MPRPYTHIRVSNFFGENDDTPVTIEDGQASTLQDWVKDRKKLKRRKGTDALGSASLSPDESLHGLEWCRINGTEHLIAVHSDDVVDFMGSTVGEVLANGTARLPEVTDANMAFVDDRLYIGNGTDQNLRYLPSGGSGSGDLAADLNGTDEYYENTASTDLETGDVDFTIAGWVWLDSIAADQAIASKWDTGTSSQREWRLYYKQSTNKFVFGAWQFASTAGAEAEADNGSALAAGQWYYVVGWHDAANNVVGCQVSNATAVTTGYALGVTSNTSDFRLGAFVGTPTYLNGRLHRFGFWKSAASGGGVLSAALKTSLYNSGDGKTYADLTAGEKTALVAYWDLTSASGDDSSSAAVTNDLTPVNAPGTAEGVDFTREIATAMVPKPSTAPTVDLDVGATHDSANETEFVYRISFLNADGEPGEPSDEAEDAAYTFNLDFTSNLTNIPVCPAGNDCTGRRIWRRSGGATKFRHVADINDNTTTSYLDEVVNGSLGDEMPSDDDGAWTNTRFPPCQYLIEHQRRMVGAGNTTDPDTLFISNVDEPYYCPESPNLEDPNQGTRARVDGPAGGEITGLCSHGGVVAVFTGGTGHLLLGVEPNDFRLQKFCDVGCAAHRTIQSARSLLIWLGHDRVYAWDGTAVKRISDDQRATLDALTAAQMAGAHAYVLDDRYHLCWSAGSIYFDLEHGIWGTYSNWLWRDSTTAPFVAGNRPRVWGAKQGAARVYELETGGTDDGTNIAAVWESKDWDMGVPGREKRARKLELKFKKTGDPATCKWTLKRGTGETVQTGSVEIGQVDANGGTVCRHEIDLNEYARDEHFRLRLEVESPTTELVLISAGLHYVYV